MMNSKELFDQAKQAYAEGNFERAKVDLDRTISAAQDDAYGLSARCLRGRAFEEGYFGKVEIEKAIEDYLVLADHGDPLGSIGPLSLARALLKADFAKNADEIIRLSKRALDLDGNVHATMVLARAHELLGNFDVASDAYLAAFRKGLPWGMRSYATLQCGRGKYLRGVLAHVVASISSPILVARYGLRNAFG